MKGTKGRKGEDYLQNKRIPKPRIDIASDKGYRVFHGRHYVVFQTKRCNQVVRTLMKP